MSWFPVCTEWRWIWWLLNEKKTPQNNFLQVSSCREWGVYRALGDTAWWNCHISHPSREAIPWHTPCLAWQCPLQLNTRSTHGLCWVTLDAMTPHPTPVWMRGHRVTSVDLTPGIPCAGEYLYFPSFAFLNSYTCSQWSGEGCRDWPQLTEGKLRQGSWSGLSMITAWGLLPRPPTMTLCFLYGALNETEKSETKARTHWIWKRSVALTFTLIQNVLYPAARVEVRSCRCSALNSPKGSSLPIVKAKSSP